MSSDRGSSGGKKGLHGNRKRSRTPSSSGSESRIAPRKPFGRTRAPERSSNNSNNRSKHNNDDTPPGAASRRSPLGTHDEFLDDVRFDVAPKDMCIASSQDSARGGDDSVVLQQLCSLGSVLAGGTSDGVWAGDEQGGGSGSGCGSGCGSSGSSGHYSADGGNGSRGAPSRDDTIGGGSLLTRWLQPTSAAHGEGCPSRASKTGRKGGGGLSGGGNNAAVASGGGGGGGGGAGTRNVGDWAKKALLRKKLADAERGRRLRLQLEECATFAGGPGGCGTASSLAPPTAATAEAAAAAAAAADQRAMEAIAASSAGSSPKESSSPPAAAIKVSQSESAAASNSTTKGKPLQRGGAPAETPAQSTASAAAPSNLAPAASAIDGVDSSGAGANSNIITSVDEEDEYGDDFGFLTDADLQALEEQAAKTAAVCSQQASSASQQHVGQRQHTTAIGSSQQAPRPPLSAIGLNPERGGGQRQESQGRATPVTAHRGGSAESSSSQGGNRGPSQLSQQRQGRVTPGRREGAANNAAFRTPSYKGSDVGTAGAADEAGLRKKRVSGGGAATAAVASQEGAPLAASDPDLFTSYNSMEAFTRSLKPGRPNAGRAPAAAGAVSDKGQARLTKWAHRQPPAGTRPMVPAAAAAAAGAPGAGQGKLPSKHPDFSAGPRNFSPALIHRRFLVLEVTYVSARDGNGTGSREKVLMALEQGRKEAMTAVGSVAVLQAKDGSDGGGGGGMAQQRKISLLEDWYDCEVEPGDVVHVLFPVASDGVDGRNGVLALPTGPKNSFGDDCDGDDDDDPEEIFISPHVVVDNRSGRLLVVQPDILVSPTKVADTVQCTRKAVLQSRLTSDASKSKPAVLGNLKHELFETSLLAAAAAAAAATKPTATATATATATPQQRAGQPTPAAEAASAWQKQRTPGSGGGGGGGDLLTSQYMTKLVNRIVVSQLEALYGAGLDEATARRELLNVSGPILQWHRSFLARSGIRGADIGVAGAGGNGDGEGGTASFNSTGARDARIRVSRVLATEDDVWSPVLGLKGIMDATVEASVQPVQAPAYGGGERDGASSTPLVMPVEVKTGKRIGDANSSHRAQVMLYTLLLRMRYGHDASANGLLVYTAADVLHTELVKPLPAEIRALMLARNRLATGMAEIGRVGLVGGEAEGQGGAALPPVIRQTRECGMCFQNSECMLYHRAAEGGDEESSGLERGVFDSKVGHLSEAHLAFFSHWDRTIDLEAKIGEQVRRTMWQESGPEREARTNKCMSDLVWLGEQDNGEDFGPTTRNAAADDASAAAVGGASNAGSKRFTHIFSREWAAPEQLLLPNAKAVTAGAAGSQPVTLTVAAHPRSVSTLSALGARGNGAGGADGSSRCNTPGRPKGVKPLTELSLSVGDMVCISAQGGGAVPGRGRRGRGRRGGGLDDVRLLTGNIAAVFDDRVEVSSARRMHVPRRGGRRGGCGNGGGAGEALDIEDLFGGGEGPFAEDRVLFRIDKDEWAAGINMMRSNLVKLMAGPSPESEAAGDTKNGGDNAGDEKRRRLIVDLEPPRFGRFTGLLDVPGTLLGWAGDRYGGNNNSDGKSSDKTQRDASPDGPGKLEAMFRTALNEDQRAAVRKLVTAKDYALLLGMPGTGKTWTIAFAVRVLLARGASVLITSYTHSAVDNLLLKLIEEGVPCLRVGKPSSVHPGVRAHCVNYDGSAKTTAAYSELVASAKVVGCTCLGVKHPLFSQRRFDYCVVDEAGQISQPVVLAPLRCADVFVLVGDHYQLPPLVTSSEALEAGMSESLFRRLCEAHPASLQRLSYQYRMNGDVMALCNDLTYSGRLRCGNAQVESQRLVLPNLGAIPPPRLPLSSANASRKTSMGRTDSRGHEGPAWQGRTPPAGDTLAPTAALKLTPWLTEVLDPDRRVAFLDTDALSSDAQGHDMEPGTGVGNGSGGESGGWGAVVAGAGATRRPFTGLEVTVRSKSAALVEAADEGGQRGRGTLVNAVECDIVRLLAWGLDAAGFDLGAVGIISPYRSQVQLLQVELKPSYPSLEMNTIDKYQGRDKKVIIVSFVRSNTEGTVGHLLRDWRRLNVALSRAKHKLLLVGSLRTLSRCAILNSLADILETRGWVYPLPPGAHRTYPHGLGLEAEGDEGSAVWAGEDAGGGVVTGSFRRALECGGGGGDGGGGVLGDVNTRSGAVVEHPPSASNSRGQRGDRGGSGGGGQRSAD
eukprot:g18638.t1